MTPPVRRSLRVKLTVNKDFMYGTHVTLQSVIQRFHHTLLEIRIGSSPPIVPGGLAGAGH